MITHDMHIVASYASRVVVLHHDGVLLDDKPEVVFACVDQLAKSSLLPPPIAQLHAQLCEKRALRVALSCAHVGDSPRTDELLALSVGAVLVLYDPLECLSYKGHHVTRLSETLSWF